MKIKKGKCSIQEWLDLLSLVAVLQYVSFRFLQSTMFPFIYSDVYKVLTMASLIMFGSARYAFLLIQSESEKRKRIIRRFLLLILIAIPFVYVGWKQDYKILIFMPVVAFCLLDMNPEKVIKGFLLTLGALLTATVLCCMAGCIRNINDISHAKMKISYGICNTTDFAAYILFFLLFIWCSLSKRAWFIDFSLAIISILTAFITYDLTQSRTTFFCCILLALFCIWKTIQEVMINHGGIIEKISRGIDGFAVTAPVLAIAVFAALLALYGNGTPWVKQLDANLSGRIRLHWEVFQRYGVSLFGTSFEMHGNGGTMILDAQGYDFLDSSYAYILIRYGLVVFVAFFSLWIWVSIKAIKSGRNKYAYAMAVMAIYALSESHIQEINFNILTVMPLCAFTIIPKGKGNKSLREAIGRTKWFSLLSALCILGSIVLVLPKGMSWFRTVVFLEQWNSGMKTIWALLSCLMFLSLLYLLWKAMNLVWYKKDKRLVIAVIFLLTIMGAGIWRAEAIIRDGQVKQKKAISAEEDTIHLIQESATQPVYAAERSELYQRSFGGFSDYAMTMEDFCRWHRGTIIVDKSNESTNTLQMGGWYAQFSENSGVYSYDPAVREALAEKGIEWKKYYYSERSCDLEDLALLNNLALRSDGSLILNGRNHSIIENRLMDQYTGNYEVRYKLEVAPETLMEDKVICTLHVTGQKGERIILEREVLSSEFDENGQCEVLISYDLADTPRMEYKVYAEGEMFVKEISWRRVS